MIALILLLLIFVGITIVNFFRKSQKIQRKEEKGK